MPLSWEQSAMKDECGTNRRNSGDPVELRQRIASLEASEMRLIKAEADLETELNKFQALYELAVAMTEERGLNQNLMLVATKGRDLLQGDASYIALRDDAAGDVYMHTFSGINTEAFRKVRVPFGAGLGGKIATTGKGLVVEDYFREIEPLLHEAVRTEGLVSGVAVPIQMGRTNLGVLYVFNRKKTRFTASHLDTLSLLGNLAAIEIARNQTRVALQQARDDLECRVEERTIELQKSNEQLKQEINQRKLAEDALRESEEKYRLVWQNAHEGIFIAAEGKFRFLNPRIVEIIGHPMEDLLSKPFTEFIHPDDAGLVLQRHNRRLKGEAIPSRYPFRMVDRSGNVKWVEIDSAHFTWEGRPAALGFMTDITDRRRMEEELWKHRHHLKEMVEERTAELKLANSQLLLEITERKKAEGALAQSEKQLRLLSAQLLTAQERERKRVAQELHDGIGQSLTAIKFKLENALNQPDKSMPNVESLKTIIPVIQDAVEEVRRISMDLRPSILDDLGILATITWFCRELQTIYSGIRIEKQIGLEENEVPKRLKIIIFRVLQEALNNVTKHSNADSVRLYLQKKGRGIELVIQDNGVGFHPDAAFSIEDGRRGFGLASMRERTESLGGCFEIVTGSQNGTEIRALWPGKGPRATRK
jgi:PAS domain S-box-containing protein